MSVKRTYTACSVRWTMSIRVDTFYTKRKEERNSRKTQKKKHEKHQLNGLINVKDDKNPASKQNLRFCMFLWVALFLSPYVQHKRSIGFSGFANTHKNYTDAFLPLVYMQN